jgi:hypothetical protein
MRSSAGKICTISAGKAGIFEVTENFCGSAGYWNATVQFSRFPTATFGTENETTPASARRSIGDCRVPPDFERSPRGLAECDRQRRARRCADCGRVRDASSPLVSFGRSRQPPSQRCRVGLRPTYRDLPRCPSVEPPATRRPEIWHLESLYSCAARPRDYGRGPRRRIASRLLCAAPGATTCSSSGCGSRSSTKRYICMPTTRWRRPKPASETIFPSITVDVLTRRLTEIHPTTFTSNLSRSR